jgi:hypothetical protein
VPLKDEGASALDGVGVAGLTRRLIDRLVEQVLRHRPDDVDVGLSPDSAAR